MDSDEWSTSGEPAARGSLLGWAVFFVLVLALLVAEITVGFFGGRPLRAHDAVALLAPAGAGGLVGLAYVVAWRDERFRPPHDVDDRYRFVAVLALFGAYFGAVQLGLASPVQLWVAITAGVGLTVAGRARAVLRA